LPSTQVYGQAPTETLIYTELQAYDPELIRSNEAIYSRSSPIGPDFMELRMDIPIEEIVNPNKLFTIPIVDQTETIATNQQFEISDYVPIQKATQTEYLHSAETFDIQVEPLDDQLINSFNPEIREVNLDESDVGERVEIYGGYRLNSILPEINFTELGTNVEKEEVLHLDITYTGPIPTQATNYGDEFTHPTVKLSYTPILTSTQTNHILEPEVLDNTMRPLHLPQLTPEHYTSPLNQDIIPWKITEQSQVMDISFDPYSATSLPYDGAVSIGIGLDNLDLRESNFRSYISIEHLLSDDPGIIDIEPLDDQLLSSFNPEIREVNLDQLDVDEDTKTYDEYRSNSIQLDIEFNELTANNEVLHLDTTYTSPIPTQATNYGDEFIPHTVKLDYTPALTSTQTNHILEPEVLDNTMMSLPLPQLTPEHYTSPLNQDIIPWKITEQSQVMDISFDPYSATSLPYDGAVSIEAEIREVKSDLSYVNKVENIINPRSLLGERYTPIDKFTINPLSGFAVQEQEFSGHKYQIHEIDNLIFTVGDIPNIDLLQKQEVYDVEDIEYDEPLIVRSDVQFSRYDVPNAEPLEVSVYGNDLPVADERPLPSNYEDSEEEKSVYSGNQRVSFDAGVDTIEVDTVEDSLEYVLVYNEDLVNEPVPPELNFEQPEEVYESEDTPKLEVVGETVSGLEVVVDMNDIPTANEEILQLDYEKTIEDEYSDNSPNSVSTLVVDNPPQSSNIEELANEDVENRIVSNLGERDELLKNSLDSRMSNILEETGFEKGSMTVYNFANGTHASSGEEDDEINPASMMKLGIFYATLLLVSEGRFSLDYNIVDNDDLKTRVMGDTKNEYSLGEVLSGMISNREGNTNYFANLLIALIGKEEITGILQSRGYNKTKVEGYFQDLPEVEKSYLEVTEDKLLEDDGVFKNYRGNISRTYDLTLLVKDFEDGAGLTNEIQEIGMGMLTSESQYFEYFEIDGLKMIKIGNSDDHIGVIIRKKNQNADYIAVVGLNNAPGHLFEKAIREGDGKSYNQITPIGIIATNALIDNTKANDQYMESNSVQLEIAS
jgi:hypothetical protein